MTSSQTPSSLPEIIENFSILDDWDDRYRYLIELGRMLEPLPEAAHSDANKVRGCASQVWLETSVRPAAGSSAPALFLRGDSDAHIVRGLVALVLAVFSGHAATTIVATDAGKVFEELGLSQHLTPQRSNGVKAMVERIKAEARAVLAAA